MPKECTGHNKHPFPKFIPFRIKDQIPYDYTVEVRNRFMGLDLIDRMPDELWNEICDIVEETVINHPHGKEM